MKLLVTGGSGFVMSVLGRHWLDADPAARLIVLDAAPLDAAAVRYFAPVAGRLEVVGRHPLVIVDGAHNVAGMIVLARSLAEEFAVEGEAQAVVGMLSGRDPTSMLRALTSAGIRSVVACAPDSPRALSVEVVADAAVGLGMEATTAGSPAEAVSLALGWAGPDDRIVVCGSLYVVADARRLMVGDRS